MRLLSRLIENVSSTTRSRQFLRVLNRMGASPAAILPFVKGLPNFTDRRFEGPEPSRRPTVRVQTSAAISALRVKDRGQPVAPVPVVDARPPERPGALAVTEYGHATSVLEIESARFLIDPVFSERVSPVRHIGPERTHRVPGAIHEIPTIDAVLISHDHYDHLDQPSIARLEQTQRPHYLVPLRSTPTSSPGACPLTGSPPSTGATRPRLQASAASAPRRDRTPGAASSTARRSGRVGRCSGRSTPFTSPATPAPSERFASIGADLGPFDLTLMPIGAYDPFWPDIHLDPEQALAAHRDVNRIGDEAEGLAHDEAGAADDFLDDEHRIGTPGGRHEEGERTTTTRTVRVAARESLLGPVHWATFNLSTHWWAEPVRRFVRGAARAGIPMATPRVGERIDLTMGDVASVAHAFSTPWWQSSAAPEDRD